MPLNTANNVFAQITHQNVLVATPVIKFEIPSKEIHYTRTN